MIEQPVIESDESYDESEALIDARGRVFAQPNEHGHFEEGDYESIPTADGRVEIQIVEQADGWRAGVCAVLPELTWGAGVSVKDAAYPTRHEAIASACDLLVLFCGEQKEQPEHSKKHRERAKAVQEWALELERVTLRDAVPVDTGCDDDRISAGDVDAIREYLDGPRAELHTSAIEMATQLLPGDEIYESPWNPRQHYPEKAMAELEASMRQSGFRLWLPLVVRPRVEGGYEIAAGHRRSRAARAAGIPLWPCIVRAMSDAEFLEVLNFDNSGREDVHPLHEASGWRAWMEKTGKGVADIAARIGQSVGYVYQRLKYSALIPDAQAAFLDGNITAGHAILLARLQPDSQAKKLKAALTPDWRGAKPSVRDLAKLIHEDEYVDLRGCVFDRADTSLLSGAGVCETCSKRAANIPGFELEDPQSDLCTDRSCYRQKKDNHLIRIKNAIAEREGEAPVTVSISYSGKQKGVHLQQDWVALPEGAKGGKTAIVADGPDQGKVIKVKLKDKAPATSGKPAAEAEAERQKEAAERAAKEQNERAVRLAILKSVCAKVGGLTRGDVEAMLSIILTGSEESEMLCELHGVKHGEYDGDDCLKTAMPKMSEREIFVLALEVIVAPELGNWQLRSAPEELLALAKRYKVDAAKIRAEVEGGTRREVEKPEPPAKKSAKDVIGKLGTLNKPAPKKAAPKTKARGPVKPPVKKGKRK